MLVPLILVTLVGMTFFVMINVLLVKVTTFKQVRIWLTQALFITLPIHLFVLYNSQFYLSGSGVTDYWLGLTHYIRTDIGTVTLVLFFALLTSLIPLTCPSLISGTTTNGSDDGNGNADIDIDIRRELKLFILRGSFYAAFGFIAATAFYSSHAFDLPVAKSEGTGRIMSVCPSGVVITNLDLVRNKNRDAGSGELNADLYCYQSESEFDHYVNLSTEGLFSEVVNPYADKGSFYELLDTTQSAAFSDKVNVSGDVPVRLSLKNHIRLADIDFDSTAEAWGVLMPVLADMIELKRSKGVNTGGSISYSLPSLINPNDRLLNESKWKHVKV